MTQGRDWWLALAWILPFTLYLCTLAPTVTTQDSGEFMTAIAYLGSAHSPGYPLFILFAKPFTWLPFGSIAFKINLATACAASLVAMLILLIVRAVQSAWSVVPRVPSNHPLVSLSGLTGGLMMAISPLLWQQTNNAKPYPLVSVLVGFVLLVLIRWYQVLRLDQHRPGYWCMAAFIAGLGTGAHQLMVLFIPGMLVFVLLVEYRLVRRLWDWVGALGAFLFGMLVQGYLVVRALAGCQQNWGNPSTLHGLFWHLLRKGYPEEPHLRSVEQLIQQLKAVSPLEQFGWPGGLLIVVGLAVLWRRSRPVCGFVFAGITMYLLVILGYFNPDQQGIEYARAFFTPVYLLLAISLAFGFLRLLDSMVSNEAWLSHRLCLACSVFCTLMLLVPSGIAEYHRQDQSRNYLAFDYAVNSLMLLPAHAVLITWGDSGAFPLWYLQGVERLRQDVDLVHVPHLPFDWYHDELPRLKPILASLDPQTDTKQQVLALCRGIGTTRPLFADYSTKRSIGFDQAPSFGILYYLGKTPLDYDPLWVWQQYVIERFRYAHFAKDPDSQAVVDIHRFQLRQEITTIEAQRGGRAAQPFIQRLLDNTEY